MSEHPPTVDQADRPGDSGHPEIDELASYAAGDLDVGRIDAVAAHLADCPDCRADVAALEGVSAQLSALPPVAMPPDVAARLTTAIERAAAPAPIGATVLPQQSARRRNPAWAAGAAAAAVVALVAAVAVGAINSSRSNKHNSVTTAGSASRESVATGRIYASGTDYSKAALTRQVGAVLSQPAAGTFKAERNAADAAGSAPAPQSFAAAASSSAAAGAAAPGGPDASFAASSAPAASSAAAPALAAPAASSSAAAAESASAASAASSAPDLKAAQPESSAAASSAPAAAPAPAAANLTALRDNPDLLARCVQSVTDGLVEPIAIDFASFEGQPALAIVLPTANPNEHEVYLVGADCGATSDAKVLYFALVAG